MRQNVDGFSPVWSVSYCSVPFMHCTLVRDFTPHLPRRGKYRNPMVVFQHARAALRSLPRSAVPRRKPTNRTAFARRAPALATFFPRFVPEASARRVSALSIRRR